MSKDALLWGKLKMINNAYYHYNQSEIEQMIQDCENRESKLSDWENGFISSIGDVVDKHLMLSEAQVNKLNDIWDRVT